MRRSIIFIATAAVLVACATSPLGRKQLRFFPDEQLDQMGVAAYAQTKQETPSSTNTVVNSYVSCVANAVTAVVDSGSRWEVTVFEKDDVNAFALPGGKIGVYTGLLKVAKNQEQLAAVISHEVAHVLARHGNERVSTAYATQTGLQLVQVVAGGASQDKSNVMALLGLGAQVGVILPFSRTQESEADLLGLDLMSKAGFDPRASVDLWKNMAAAGGGGPEFLSTHPSSGTRIKDLENRMPRALPLYQQARAQGRVPRCQ
jgi:predicted Zn-dependent protease